MELDFEKKVYEIDEQINELKKLQSLKRIEYSPKIRKLEKEKVRKLKKIYSNLSTWQIVQIARHPKRPKFQDYLENIVLDFKELHGDRCFGDDKSITTGIGMVGRNKIMVIGQNKGRTTKENIKYNFGYVNPEGYRKALLKMKFAEKYKLPIVSFIDTKGADARIEAEERGQAYAIAQNLKKMSKLKTPIIAIVIGEGGSGGALGIGVADKFAMLEYSYYSVITPEACAAILWKDKKYAKEAAEALKLTSKDLIKLGLIDYIIQEPLGSAWRNYHETFSNVRLYIEKTINDIKSIPLDELLKRRYEKLMNIGKISKI